MECMREARADALRTSRSSPTPPSTVDAVYPGDYTRLAAEKGLTHLSVVGAGIRLRSDLNRSRFYFRYTGGGGK